MRKRDIEKLEGKRPIGFHGGTLREFLWLVAILAIGYLAWKYFSLLENFFN